MNIKISYHEIQDAQIVNMERAIDLLSSYWALEYIKPALIRGEVLHTPFASFKLI
jgi:hypothetical protein